MALRTKGLFLAQQGQPQAALVALEEVDKRYAGDKPPVMREQVAYALIEKGKVFLEQNQHRQAHAAFDQVIERYKGEYGMSRAVDLAEFYRYGAR
jgi:TolA-binding protein